MIDKRALKKQHKKLLEKIEALKEQRNNKIDEHLEAIKDRIAYTEKIGTIRTEIDVLDDEIEMLQVRIDTATQIVKETRNTTP